MRLQLGIGHIFFFILSVQPDPVDESTSCPSFSPGTLLDSTSNSPFSTISSAFTLVFVFFYFALTCAPAFVAHLSTQLTAFVLHPTPPVLLQAATTADFLSIVLH